MTKRTWIYAQSPAIYGLSLCKCGHKNPEWSEFEKRLWCPKCKKDFIPKSGGVFDSPILVECCALLGIFFHRIDLKTDQFQIFMPDNVNKRGEHKMIPVKLKPKELAELKRFFDGRKIKL